MNGRKVYSFDVFDTLLVRSGYEPRDLLHQCESRFLESKDSGGREAWTGRWFPLRLTAEATARQRAGGDIENLGQIYEILRETAELSSSETADLMQHELATEQSDLRLIRRNGARLKQLTAAGERVVLITDMYFSANQIGDLLRGVGLPVSDEQVFVSCEHNAVKWKGGLFRIVAGRLGIPRSRLHHLGNHFLADVASAWWVGARANWYRDWRPNRHERLLADAGLRAYAGLAKQLRLSSEPGAMPEARLRFYADVCAPLLCSFLQWVRAEAARRGITRLYFVARDGWVMHRIAGKMDFGGVELRYIHGSRQAWRTAAPDFSDAVKAGMSLRPDRILERLGLSAADFREPLAEAGLGALDAELDASGVSRLRQVWESPEVQSAVRNAAARRRDALLGYAEQEALLEDDRWALVDIGWSLTSQSALRSVLRTRKANAEVRGFYLGLRRDRVPAEQSGPAWGFAAEEEANPDARGLVMQFSLLEQLTTPAPHGSTIGYREEESGLWEPVLADNRHFVDPDSCERIAEVYTDFVRSVTARRLPDLPRDTALALCAQFFLRPNRRDIQTLRGCSVATDPAEHDRRPVVGRFSSLDLTAFLFRNVLRKGRGGYFQRRFMWMAASIPRWDLPMRLFFRLLVVLKLHGTRLS